jgi:hypothetical protein
MLWEGNYIMLRSEIITNIRAVETLLKDPEVLESLRTVASEKGITPELLSSVMRSVVSLSAKYSTLPDAARPIVAAVGLADMFDSEWWAQAITARAPQQARGSSPMGLMRRRDAAIAVLPGISEMLEQGHRVAISKSAPAKVESSALQLIFPEPHNATSSRRVTTGLLAIEELYEAIARLQDQPIDSLAIAACDSGSNKVFDFKGLGSVVEGVRQVVIEIWDRVHLRTERKASAQIDVIVKGLDAYAKMNELRESKKISAEQAVLIEKALTSGTIKFIDAGVLTRDISERQLPPPEALAQPAKPLLLPSPNDEAPSNMKRKSVRRKRPPPSDAENENEDL